MALRTRIWRLLNREVIPGRRRGAALPVVLIVVAVMTTIVVQFVHNSRTNLHMAANARDEVRAYYNAKAAMDLARLALEAQTMIDALTGAQLNIQVWQYLNQFMGIFNAGRVDTPIGGVDLAAVKGLGGIKGSFDVEVVAEDGKINLNALASNNRSARDQTLARLLVMMAPAQYREMFEQRNEDGEVMTPQDIVAGIVDWVDTDEDLTTVNADGQFVAGGSGQESSRYSAFGEGYEARNSKFDTTSELHLVKGIGDAWWSAFHEALTIYPSDKINVNTASPLLLAVLLCSNLTNPADPFCDPLNPLPVVATVQAISLYRTMMQNFFMTPFASTQSFQQFVQGGGDSRGWLAAAGIVFEPPQTMNWGQLTRSIEVKSPKVYKVIAKGTVGNTLKTLTAVVDISKKGRLLYWREF